MGAAMGAYGGFEMAEHHGDGMLGDLAGAGVGGFLGSKAEQGLYNQFSNSSGGGFSGGDPYNQYSQNQFGQDPYAQNQFGQDPYARNQYGQFDPNAQMMDPSMGYDAPAPKHHHKLGNVAGAVGGFELGEKMGGGFLGDLAGAGIGAWAGGALEGKLRDRKDGGFY
eukprot:GGOE01041489.1.p1 GENE.GGOE01041489.1~~GGOE01041489.1.p1  ORF type:complete len:189 (+),score=48.00 GGOE01041489.1:70-567(+)